jgi:hypothetical protein
VSDVTGIPERDLGLDPCCLCGVYEVREYTHLGKPIAEFPPVCSPCRAERLGAIHIRLPKAAAPGDIADRVKPFLGSTDLPGAIHVGLRTWHQGLADALHSVVALLQCLEDRPSEEQVVAELMGTPLVGGLEFLPDPETAGLKLTGLAPELARRIAELVPLAEGPALSLAHEAEIRLLVTERAAEQKTPRAARHQAQPTAAPQKTPADGSDGDGA